MFSRRLSLVVVGAPLVSSSVRYCPTLQDFDVAWGNVTAESTGWRIHGGGAVHGRTSWNLLGGWIAFQMDVCGAKPGINSNFYTISPEGGPSNGYCDIQDGSDHPTCLELDMVETNGQCLGQSTWHVWADHDGGCDQSGCFGQFHLDDGCKFLMRTDFGEDGSITHSRNGQVIQVTDLSTREKIEIKETMKRAGAAIESTQWFGWAPDDGSCDTGDDLDGSQFAITNVIVHAPKGIKFGPTPPICADGPPVEAYCPTLQDFDTYGENVTTEDNGWRIHGSGGVHGRTSWNLLGGSIDFDMDVCGAQPGINSNFYTVSPEGGPSTGYCDIQDSNRHPTCLELDMVENNGQCLGQSTWHVWADQEGGCDQRGCAAQFHLDDGCKFHMRTEFGEDGSLTHYRNGQVIEVSYFGNREKKEIKQTMERAGAAIESTQWFGWAPDDGSCKSGDDLESSTFAVTNVVVRAPKGIKFGPAPPACDEAFGSFIAV